MHFIDPEGERTVVGAWRSGGLPVEFDHVWDIVERNNACTTPSGGVVDQGCSQLIGIVVPTEFHAQHDLGRTLVAIEEVVGVTIRHDNAVGIKIETGTIARFRIGAVIGDEHGDIVVEQRVHALYAN